MKLKGTRIRGRPWWVWTFWAFILALVGVPIVYGYDGGGAVEFVAYGVGIIFWIWVLHKIVLWIRRGGFAIGRAVDRFVTNLLTR